MRTLLINLPWQEGKYSGVKAGSRWPFKSLPEADGDICYIPFPFFLAYATSFLKKNGKEAKLFDCIAEKAKEDYCIAKIKNYGPSLIVAETSTPSFYNDIKIIKNIKNNLPSVQVVLCGPHASTFPRNILSQHGFIDYILAGEYEYNLLKFIKCLEKKNGLHSVSGLAYREGKVIKVNCFRGAIRDLNIFPWPEREDVQIHKYNDGFCNLPAPNIQMVASRGCPYFCTFCLWPQVIYGEHKYRKRDPIDVVNEMEYLIDKYKPHAVYFDDDVFNIDSKYTFNICREIIRRNIKVPWACMARADLMNEGLLDVMKEAGLYAVKYGIESADKKILKLCKKSMALDKARNMIKLSKRFGIKVHLTFCIGLPGETKESISKTIAFVNDTSPDSLQVSFATPFPGTELYHYLRDKDIPIPDKWSEYDGNYKCIVEAKELDCDYLEKIRNDLCNRYHF